MENQYKHEAHSRKTSDRRNRVRLCLAAVAMLAYLLTPTACRMAPKDNPGDTVAASAFAPVDTALLNKRRLMREKKNIVKDSTDIFYVGDGSDSHSLQLVSYPSRKDTFVYAKAEHIRKKGNADYGHVIRVTFYVSDKNDTLIRKVEEMTFNR